jgi:hypothetical protein
LLFQQPGFASLVEDFVPVCDDDIALSNNRRILVVSETELCGSGDEKTFGSGRRYSYDGLGHLLHLVSILQSDGVDKNAGMG